MVLASSSKQWQKSLRKLRAVGERGVPGPAPSASVSSRRRRKSSRRSRRRLKLCLQSAPPTATYAALPQDQWSYRAHFLLPRQLFSKIYHFSVLCTMCSLHFLWFLTSWLTTRFPDEEFDNGVWHVTQVTLDCSKNEKSVNFAQKTENNWDEFRWIPVPIWPEFLANLKRGCGTRWFWIRCNELLSSAFSLTRQRWIVVWRCTTYSKVTYLAELRWTFLLWG